MFFFNSVDSIRTFFPRKMESFFIGRRLAGDYTLSNPTKAISVLSKMDNEAVKKNFCAMVETATQNGGRLTYGMMMTWALNPWLKSHRANRLRFLTDLCVCSVSECVALLIVEEQKAVQDAAVMHLCPPTIRAAEFWKNQKKERVNAIKRQMMMCQRLISQVALKLGEMEGGETNEPEEPEAPEADQVPGEMLVRIPGFSLNGDE